MALSDSCFDFLQGLEPLARELMERAEHYGEPDHPIPYGRETETLQVAAKAVARDPTDLAAALRLVSLAHATLRHHDCGPDDPAGPGREKVMVDLCEEVLGRPAGVGSAMP